MSEAPVKPTIIFDEAAAGPPFYVRYEEDGVIKFLDLLGVVTQPAAKKMAAQLGFPDCDFINMRNHTPYTPKGIK